MTFWVSHGTGSTFSRRALFSPWQHSISSAMIHSSCQMARVVSYKVHYWEVPLSIHNTFSNHYPSFFSFTFKEHYYTVHGIGEKKRRKQRKKWDKIFGDGEKEAVTKALKIHNLLDDFSCCYFLREKTKVEERRRDTSNNGQQQKCWKTKKGNFQQ